MKANVKALILVFSLFLFGCAQQPIKIDVPDIARSTNVVVKDLRPATEKEKETFSYSITSSAYGIYRIGDMSFEPSPIRALQHRAFLKAAANTGDQTVLTVHHLVVYVNGKSAMRSSVLGGVFGGVVGAVIANSVSSTTTRTENFFGTLANRQVFDAQIKEEHERAFYTESESIKDSTVYVIYIDAEVNGKRTFTKTISPASYNEKKNALASAVETSLDFFLSQNAK